MLTIVALLGLLIAPRIAATACGHPADRDVTAGAAAVSMPAAASTDAAQEADDPRTDRALLGSVVAVDGGPSALELEEPQEELHALAAAVGRRLSHRPVTGVTPRGAPRPVIACWHVVAPGRAPPA